MNTVVKKKGKQSQAASDYFDITKLFKVMDAQKWTEGKNFMKFWAEGNAKIASVDPAKKKSTIGANVNNNLRIYTVKWSWLNQFASANLKYQELFRSRLNNTAVQNLIKRKYCRLSTPGKLVTPFNDWLVDNLEPAKYLSRIKSEQLQFINVNPYDMNGGKFNDLVAALNGYNYFAFYKGVAINAQVYRNNNKPTKAGTQPKPGSNPLTGIIPQTQLKAVEAQLARPNVKSVIYVSHVGVYAGDIYEFNGSQYLATWDIVNNTVELSNWDYMFGTSDTDDDTDLAITNETYNIYRKKTGKGGDFLALTPIRLSEYPMVISVN